MSTDERTNVHYDLLGCFRSQKYLQCHCDDGWGGTECEEPDLNECKYRPCSLFAHCTNTLGSFYCTCRPGYKGDGFECSPEVRILVDRYKYRY